MIVFDFVLYFIDYVYLCGCVEVVVLVDKVGMMMFVELEVVVFVVVGWLVGFGLEVGDRVVMWLFKMWVVCVMLLVVVCVGLVYVLVNLMFRCV